MKNIKQLGVNLFASIAAVSVFILMLPLTILAMSLLFISGLIGVAVMRYKLRHAQPVVITAEKAPIEGRYKVMKD